MMGWVGMNTNPNRVAMLTQVPNHLSPGAYTNEIVAMMTLVANKL